MNRRMLLALVAAGLLATFGWWLQDQLRPGPAAESTASSQPDYYMDAFTATTLTAEGNPQYRLTAESLQHFPADGHAELVEPRLTLFQTDGAPWKVTAERGWTSSDGAEVRLLGTVHMTRAPTATNRPVRVTTADLFLRPDEGYAETAERVHAESGASSVQSIGMRAYMNEGRLELLSQVRGVHEPSDKELR